MRATSRPRPSVVVATVGLLLWAVGCGSDDAAAPAATAPASAPESGSAPPLDTTSDTSPDTTGQPVDTTAAPGDPSAAQSVLAQLLADKSVVDSAVLGVDRNAEPTVWQNQVLAVRTALFDLDANLRSSSAVAPATTSAANEFLAGIAPAFTILDEVITATSGVEPQSLQRAVAETVGEVQRMVVSLAGELHVLAGGAPLAAPLGDRLIDLATLDAAGLEGNTVIWYNDDKTVDTNCAQPGSSGVEPIVTEGLYFNTNTGANGWDMVQLFASDADATAYMTAFFDDQSCWYSDSVFEVLEDGFRVSTPQGGGSVLVVQGRVEGALFHWANVLFFNGGGADDPAAAVLDLLLA